MLALLPEWPWGPESNRVRLSLCFVKNAGSTKVRSNFFFLSFKAATMSAATDKARYFLEKSVPELKEFEKKKLFSKVNSFERAY